ncbi:MAG: hypothetical protein HYV63_24320 [Candidatus Schekmanbacteria bacterium]|nr:hypothetical protein [Candidatus Schekmanbacteria bacterium]
METSDLDSDRLRIISSAAQAGADIGPYLPVLWKCLATPSVERRLRDTAAGVMLSFSIDHRHWSEAGELLAHPDTEAREGVFKELKALLDLREGLALEPLLPQLIAILGDDGSSSLIQDTCARALVRLAEAGVDMGDAASTLRRRLTRATKITRRQSALALAIHAAATGDLATVQALRESADPNLRTAVVRGLARRPDAGSARDHETCDLELTAALADGHPSVRRAALDTLRAMLDEAHGDLPAKRAIARRISALLEPLRAISREATALAEKCACLAVLPVLPEELEAEATALSTASGQRARDILGRLRSAAREGVDLKPVHHQLTALLGNADDQISDAATRTLAVDCVTQRRFGMVEELLHHPDARVHRLCADLVSAMETGRDVGHLGAV